MNGLEIIRESKYDAGMHIIWCEPGTEAAARFGGGYRRVRIVDGEPPESK
jgi:hypothetical protein